MEHDEGAQLIRAKPGYPQGQTRLVRLVLRLHPGEVGNKQALFGGFCIILGCLVGSGE